MKVVFSLGGSIIAPSAVDEEYVRKVSDFLVELSKKHAVGVVVGGGAPARKRIAEARKNGASEAECDFGGITATRENARAVINVLGDRANHNVPESVRDAVKLYGRKILVMGGTEPGHSTDAVAALLAEWVKADLFVNASNVDSVYDKNPRKFRDARPLPKITIDELTRLLQDEGVNAGEYPLLDPVALKILKRSKLKTVILDGRDLENMRKAVEGKDFKGTTVQPQ